MSYIQRFFLVFTLTLITQTFIWNHISITDESLWVTRIANLSPGDLTPADITEKRYSSTPGTLTVFVGQALGTLGFSLGKTLYLAVSLLVSLAAATAAGLAKTIAPTTPWWIPVGALIATHPLYADVTPVDAVVAPLLAVCALLFLWYVQLPHKTTLQTDIFFGVVIGMAAATRLHMAAIMVAPALLLLQRIIGLRRSILIGGSAICIAIALNPFLGYIPSTYIQVGAVEDTLTYSEKSETAPARGIDSFSFASFAVVSCILAIGYIAIQAQLMTAHTIDRRFLISLIGISILVTTTLFTASIPLPRYFFSLVLAWEVLLPLFLFHLLEHASQTKRMHAWHPVTTSTAVVVLTTLPTISLLLFSILLSSSLPPLQ